MFRLSILMLTLLVPIHAVITRDGYGPDAAYDKQSNHILANMDHWNFCMSEKHKGELVYYANSEYCGPRSGHSCRRASLDTFTNTGSCTEYGLHNSYMGLHISFTDTGSVATYHSALFNSAPRYGAVGDYSSEYTTYGGMFEDCPPHSQSFSVSTLACVMSDFNPVHAHHELTAGDSTHFLVKKMRNPRKYYWYRLWAPSVNWGYQGKYITLYDQRQVKAVPPYKPLRMPSGGFYIDPNAEQVMNFFYNTWEKYRPVFDNESPVSLNCQYEGPFNILCNRRQVPLWGPHHTHFGSKQSFFFVDIDSYPKWFQTKLKHLDMQLRGTTENSQWTPIVGLLSASLALWAFVGIMYGFALLWTCFEFAHAQAAKASISPAGTLLAFTFRSLAIVSFAGYKNTLSKKGEEITAVSKANAEAFHVVMKPVTYALAVLGTFLFPIYIPIIIVVGLFSLRGTYKYRKPTQTIQANNKGVKYHPQAPPTNDVGTAPYNKTK